YNADSRLGANLGLSHAESFDMFEDVWKKTLLELRMYLNDPTDEETSADEHDAFAELQGDLQSLCTEFDVNAVDFLLEHEQTFQDCMPPANFKALRRAVLDYDFLWLTEHQEVWI
ncbi:MAG: hypothetical protein K2I93_05310, partial [Oscillospiraceae bacterium]|nr:hypothetical protein [Oscillospiraceae bacterium]